MTNKNLSLMIAVTAFSSACGLESSGPRDVDVDVANPTDGAVESIDTPEVKPPGSIEPPVIALSTDRCDDAAHAGEAWKQTASHHFALNFFAGTPADLDQSDILAKREAAYNEIRTALGVTQEPLVTAYLTPSRLAASANGRGAGTAYPGQNRIEVLYTGADDSYESNRYGHELTHILEAYIDPVNLRRHPFMSEGLAEYLDQSGRDMHAAYAQQLLAGMETRVRLTTLESRDVSARNYGRAGSFVQLLVERYGMPTFLDIFRATAVTWTNGCWTHAKVGCVNTPEKLTAMLDDAIQTKAYETWAVVQQAWEQKVHEALASADTELPAADVKEIENLVRVGDLAIARRDADMYRSTLDGFYCDATADAMRDEVSRRAVSAMTGMTSKIEGIRATGIKNFRTAQVFVRRTDSRGLASFITLSVEHLPMGWRVTWGPDWF